MGGRGFAVVCVMSGGGIFVLYFFYFGFFRRGEGGVVAFLFWVIKRGRERDRCEGCGTWGWRLGGGEEDDDDDDVLLNLAHFSPKIYIYEENLS